MIEFTNGKYTVTNPSTGEVIGRFNNIEEAKAALGKFTGAGTVPQPKPQGLGMAPQGQMLPQGGGLGMAPQYQGSPQGGGAGILALLQALLGGR